MSTQELNLIGPEGQRSFDSVDSDLLSGSLGGRRIDRTLGRFGAGKYEGHALLLDDDSVFMLKRWTEREKVLAQSGLETVMGARAVMGMHSQDVALFMK